MPNVFIVTTGQSGSRMVTGDFVDAGYSLPSWHNAGTLSSDYFEDGWSEATNDFYEPTPKDIQEVRAFVDGHQNTVFKSRGLILFTEHLQGLVVGHYRHPYQWKCAIEAKRKPRDFPWYAEYNRRLLALRPDFLFNFSDYRDDALRAFGQTRYDPSKVRQREIRPVPEEAIEIYEGLEKCRAYYRKEGRLPSIPTRTS